MNIPIPKYVDVLECVGDINSGIHSFDNPTGLENVVNPQLFSTENYLEKLPDAEKYSIIPDDDFSFQDNSEDYVSDLNKNTFDAFADDSILTVSVIKNTFVNFASCITNTFKDFFVKSIDENWFWGAAIAGSALILTAPLFLDYPHNVIAILFAGLPMVLSFIGFYNRFHKKIHKWFQKLNIFKNFLKKNSIRQLIES